MSSLHENKPSIMDIFVNRPVLAIVLSLLIILAGVNAARQISVQQYPKIESASLVINTVYTGAAADVVKGYVTEPIERVASTVPGVDYVDSVTTSGLSKVTAWLDLNHSTTDALAELTTRLNQIKFELPTGAEDPAIQIVRADSPYAVFYLDVESQGLPRNEVSDYLVRNVVPSMSDIPGVQKVTLEGGRNPAMRVWLDTDKLAIYNLSASDVFAALQANNTIATIGYTENNRQRIDLMANTSLKSVADFEQLVVKETDTAQLKLGDIADIEIGEAPGMVTARLDYHDTVFLAVWALPGANEINIGDALYAKLAEINQILPDGMKISIGYDGTLYMRDSIKEIFTTLAETVLLVGIVVVAMMGSFRTAMVPLITIPISILGAIAVISVMGFSLNLLTILAIVLSVGLVVDDAIVVVENVARHMREGKPRLQAALISSRQLLVPVIAMTLTLAAVYAPIGFLTGLTGFLFREFAFTLAIAVLISGLVAVTLSPIMSAYVSPEGGKEGKLTQAVNGYFDRLQAFYFKSLDTLFQWRTQIFFVAIVFSLLSVPFYLLSQKELAPIEDQSSVQVVIEAPPESSQVYTAEKMNETARVMNATEGGQFTWQIVTAAAGFGGVELAPYEERENSVHDLLFDLYGRLGSVTGLSLFPILPASLPTAGQFDVEVVLRSSDDAQTMKQYADQIIAKANASGQFMFVNTDLKIDLPQAELEIDRLLVADLGLDLADVNNQLSVLMSNNFVNYFNKEGKAYRVIPIVDDDERYNPENILDMQVRNDQGTLIPVSAFATLRTFTSPRVLGSFNQQDSFRILAGVLPHITKEQGLSSIEDIAKEILPAHYSIDYAGESRQLRKEGNTMVGVLLVAMIVVYFLLAIQFNSFRDPLVVLLGCAPLALSGALMLPFLSLTTVNIYSQIGLITLIGLIAKNGILIVEFANHLQLEGKNKFEAVKGAAATRLRPILMTTGATVLGHFPLVLVTGAGAEARNSIGIILVAGMLIGTFFTLIVLPLLYEKLASDHRGEVESEKALNETQFATEI
ncbi:efflux RND transporter permease subunit [Pseudoalteromonas luteoviolacea]|uniref:Acriflavine resistance protein B n=1 Tax=Pseudoalteromonas luteoviolacea S4054 TaxID=1129367 RepID=A0A0F6A8N5_9GAMM|nr:efflux RND transporter permease subunit [Pseudoalteromonas luteoviolacea]AOT11104.1 acriflavine resistance protein B [Pseudoalteromonas luteoviolacea]AOT15732.1 acriflavine resistance protein B [Pseudoalteromonas luteoviolacea]AOT20925.1 acriflavine resistance protein B [Pseudoalteromonas luteoviolacea]KKE82206.1 acriflavine resistance protein B [Pseudoalteromonas luteoviolacea S4054]KZN65462.1 acriflavine resistance protein B [Pseudoalteromonas luteoviolacea S4047-1]